MDEYEYTFQYERRTRSLSEAADPASGSSLKSSKSLSRNRGIACNVAVRFSSGQLSRISPPLRNNILKDQDNDADFASSSSETHINRGNISRESAGGGNDDEFRESSKYASPNSKAQPSISMYDEIFRTPTELMSSSRLSNLPVFDVPSYRSDDLLVGAPGTCHAPDFAYEDIFGGGLSTGPTHVGVHDLFEKITRRSMSSSRSTSRFQSPKPEESAERDASDANSSQNESFEKTFRRPWSLKTVNSFPQRKGKEMPQPPEPKLDQISSTFFNSFSSSSFSDVDVLVPPESTIKRDSIQSFRNGMVQRNCTGGSTQYKGQHKVSTQMPLPTGADAAFRKTQNIELPIFKVHRTKISSHFEDWLESNDAACQCLSHKDSRLQDPAKVERAVNSPTANSQDGFLEREEGEEVWLTVEKLKLMTSPTATPPPARSPPSPGQNPLSLIARRSESNLDRSAHVCWNESFDGESNLSPSYEGDYSSHCPTYKTSVPKDTSALKRADLSTVNYSAVKKNDRKISTAHSRFAVGNIMLKAQDNLKLSEGEEYASLDASLLETGADGLARPTDTSRERGHKLRRDHGRSQEAKEMKAKEKNGNSVAKENYRDKKERKIRMAAEWEKHPDSRQILMPESVERENLARNSSENSDERAAIKAAGDILLRDNIGTSKEGTRSSNCREKANRIELRQWATVNELERREKEVRLEREKERSRREREIERQREREKDNMEIERSTNEAKEKIDVEAHTKLERRAQSSTAKVQVYATSDKADRRTVERMAAETHASAAHVVMDRGQQEARGTTLERETVEKFAADASEKIVRAAAENLAPGRRYSRSYTISTTEIPAEESTLFSKHRHGMSDPGYGMVFTDAERKRMTRVAAGINCASNTSTSDSPMLYSSNFLEVEGETVERRQARWDRHQQTLERVAKALAEKNQRDLEVQQEQAEKCRVAGILDVEIQRWSAGKQGNIRALLSALQLVLWRDSGWQPVSLNDLISPASVKKAYRKATLCVHPDKVQQKNASVQQKYTAEKVFDLLKEAWNKFNLEEQC